MSRISALIVLFLLSNIYRVELYLVLQLLPAFVRYIEIDDDDFMFI